MQLRENNHNEKNVQPFLKLNPKIRGLRASIFTYGNRTGWNENHLSLILVQGESFIWVPFLFLSICLSAFFLDLTKSLKTPTLSL